MSQTNRQQEWKRDLSPYTCYALKKYVNILPIQKFIFKKTTGDFSGGTVVKNLPSNAGDVDSIPGQGARSHMPQLRSPGF